MPPPRAFEAFQKDSILGKIHTFSFHLKFYNFLKTWK